MPILKWEDVRIEVDSDGFLKQPEGWSKRIAQALASTEGLHELTEDHWRVVDYIRDHYQKHNIAPMIRKLCRETGYSLKYLYELFPSGPALGACKVAGLPKPEGCV